MSGLGATREPATPEEEYPGQAPCPCCFESSGHPARYVPATWTDPAWEDVDYTRNCPECEGTGYVDAELITLEDLEELNEQIPNT